MRNEDRWACPSRSGSTPRKPETVMGNVVGGLRPSVVRLTIPDPAEQVPLVARSVTPPSPSGRGRGERGDDTASAACTPRSCTVFVMTPPQMNTPVREGETIEGSRTTRNRDPIQCSSAQVGSVYGSAYGLASSLSIRAGGAGTPSSMPTMGALALTARSSGACHLAIKQQACSRRVRIWRATWRMAPMAMSPHMADHGGPAPRSRPRSGDLLGDYSLG